LNFILVIVIVIFDAFLIGFWICDFDLCAVIILVSDVFWLQYEESNMGVSNIWDLPLHWLFCCSSKSRCSY